MINQVYICFKPRDNVAQHAVLDHIKHNLVDIETWMYHMLKLSTEFQHVPHVETQY